LTAIFLQMAVASIGLVSLIQNSRQFFLIVKWAGVVYLVYLGLKMILARSSLRGEVDSQKSGSRKYLYWQGFITSAANPKAVVFFSALFPQFIVSTEPLLPQFVILSFTYLTIDGILLCFYGKFAEFIFQRLSSQMSRYFNQISGLLLIAAAILLGLKDFEKQ